jgi:hypothetical protein
VRHVRMRVLGLSLVAALAVVAFTATSASALPEFGQCVVEAAHEGKYTESNCIKKAKKDKVTKHFTGEYEWRKASEIPAEKRHFVGAGGAGVLDGIYTICESEKVREENCHEGEEEHYFLSEPGEPLKIECESEANTGEVSGNKTVSHIAVIFRGCKVLGSAPCSNTEHEGEIQVNELKGSIGWVNKKASPREVGLLLEPKVKKGQFAKFGCLGGLIGTVVGEGNEKEGCAYPLKKCGGDGIIGLIGPVDTMTSEQTQAFTANEETAENEPSKFEGTKPLKVLESYVYNVENPEYTTKWSPAGETVTNLAHLCQHPDVSLEQCLEEPELGEIKATA